MMNYNINDNIIQFIEALYKDSSNAVPNSHLREFFKTAVGVHQTCLISPVLFNIYLENPNAGNIEHFSTFIFIREQPF